MATAISKRVSFLQPLLPVQEHDIVATKGLLSHDKLSKLLTKTHAEATEKKLAVNNNDADQAAAVYNAVVKDGRYIKEFQTDPAGTATKLHLELTASAANAVKQGVSLAHAGGGGPVSDTVDVICVAIIVIVLAKPGEQGQNILVDRSGMLKY